MVAIEGIYSCNVILSILQVLKCYITLLLNYQCPSASTTSKIPPPACQDQAFTPLPSTLACLLISPLMLILWFFLIISLKSSHLVECKDFLTLKANCCISFISTPRCIKPGLCSEASFAIIHSEQKYELLANWKHFFLSHQQTIVIS